MRVATAILGAASALALVSPALANGVTPYSEVPSYGVETYKYEYRTQPPVVVEEAPPAVVVRRPVVVAPPPVVVEEYPVYAAPRIYAVPHAYAYAGPGWRGGWNYRRHFHGGW
jgi:hypothetical protein